jgi:threonine/homoserine/homoserine lactone efflux protein
MDYLIAITLFAVSSSITPGPNNMLVMTSGVNYGIRKSIPLLLGICVGFSAMLLVVGFGLNALFQARPELITAIKVFGIVYLLYLSLLIWRTQSLSETMQSKPLGFMNGAMFQWVNGKAWVVALGAISVFTQPGQTDHWLLSAIFLVVSLLCVGTWLLFGSALRTHLNSHARNRLFNRSMAILLVLSVVPIIVELLA